MARSDSDTPEIVARIRVEDTDKVAARLQEMRDKGTRAIDDVGVHARAAGDEMDKIGDHAEQSGVKLSRAFAIGAVGAVGAAVALKGLAEAHDSVAGLIKTKTQQLGEALDIDNFGGDHDFKESTKNAKEYARGLIENIVNLRGVSDATGYTVEQISRFNAAVRLAGGESFDFADGLDTIGKAYRKALTGDDIAQLPFAKLGFVIRDAQGEASTFNDTLEATFAALARIQGESENYRKLAKEARRPADAAENTRLAVLREADAKEAATALFGADGAEAVLKVTKPEGQENLASRLKASSRYNTTFDRDLVDAIDDRQPDKEVPDEAVEEAVLNLKKNLALEFQPLLSERNPVKELLAVYAQSVAKLGLRVSTYLQGLQEDYTKTIGNQDHDDAIDTLKRKLGVQDGKSGRELEAQNEARARGDDDDGGGEEEKDPGEAQAERNATIKNPILRTIAPAVQFARKALLDLYQAYAENHRLGDTVPVLRDLATGFHRVSRDTTDAADSFDKSGRPTSNFFAKIGDGFETVRRGIVRFAEIVDDKLKSSNVPLFRALGIGLDYVVTTFRFASLAVSDAVRAIFQAVTQRRISVDNLFYGLNALGPHLLAIGDTVVAAYHRIVEVTFAAASSIADITIAPHFPNVDDIGAIMESVVSVVVHAVEAIINAFADITSYTLTFLLPIMRSFAETIGLKGSDGKGSALALSAVGLLIVLTPLGAILARVLKTLLSFVDGIATFVFYASTAGKALVGLIATLATELEVSFLVASGWFALGIAILALAFYFRDAVWAVFKALYLPAFQALAALLSALKDTLAVIRGDSSATWETVLDDLGRFAMAMLAPILNIEKAFAAAFKSVIDGAKQAWDTVLGYVTGTTQQRNAEHLKRVAEGKEDISDDDLGSEEVNAKRKVEADKKESRDFTEAAALKRNEAVVVKKSDFDPTYTAEEKEIMKRQIDRYYRGIEKAAGAVLKGGGTPEQVNASLREVGKETNTNDPGFAGDLFDTLHRDDLDTATQNERIARELESRLQERQAEKGTGVLDRMKDLLQDSEERRDARSAEAGGFGAAPPAVDGSQPEQFAAPSEAPPSPYAQYFRGLNPFAAPPIGQPVAPPANDDEDGAPVPDEVANRDGQMQPLTLVIGGRKIGGLGYTPGALEEIQAAQDADMLGRAPLMRGAQY